jgi:hypothetical protein
MLVQLNALSLSSVSGKTDSRLPFNDNNDNNDNNDYIGPYVKDFKVFLVILCIGD